MIEVLDGGMFTTVQDSPGRIGFWHVGVPPNGPMDDLAHALANRVVGNAAHAAALELTGTGPTLRFDTPATIAIGGAAMPMFCNGSRAYPYEPVELLAGAVVRIGPVDGPGQRAALAVRGGIDVPPYLGSRATFTLGRFGGHEGRVLRQGDVLRVAEDVDPMVDPGPLAVGLAPTLGSPWQLGVLVGPHAEPDFLADGGLSELVTTRWQVHFNSARTGVRLVGPHPRWARADGGDAGLHPSNIHDTGYAIGAVDLTGDMPIILGPDGPSLGGFVCPLVVAAAERWKLGQLAPGDLVEFAVWTPDDAATSMTRRRSWIASATTRVDPVARPKWNARVARAKRPVSVNPVIDRRRSLDSEPTVEYRRAGDRFLLVEYGPMELNLELRVRVQALERWVQENLTAGVVDATAGTRSLLIQVDDETLTVEKAAAVLRAAQDEVGDVTTERFPSRIVHLPLSWDDPATREAISRYINGVRADAPWCPWNIEFIRRVNGLESVEDVHRIVFDASYFVVGLGDVYLGAPVATPLDPRHRLVTTKYNPARTWTAENSVGIGGAYLCIYGMEGPGGYQLIGRTTQVWNSAQHGPYFQEPWLLRTFDQIRWYPVDADTLLELRAAHANGEFAIRIEDSEFCLADYTAFLDRHSDSIDAFRTRQKSAFATERVAWAAAGEFRRA